MKTCTINGDMSSDRTNENYPIVQVCDECCKTDEKLKEDQKIISIGKYDPSFGDSCELCDKTYEEELQEK